MDPDEAIELLCGDGASPAADPALVNGAVGEIFVDAIEGRRRGRAGPGPVVNLKHDRGPIPASVHATFRELCRQPHIHNLLEALDELIEPLEGVPATPRDWLAERRFAPGTTVAHAASFVIRTGWSDEQPNGHSRSGEAASRSHDAATCLRIAVLASRGLDDRQMGLLPIRTATIRATARASGDRPGGCPETLPAADAEPPFRQVRG